MKLFLFDDVPGDTKIAVNPDQVRFLRERPDGQVTIVFTRTIPSQSRALSRTSSRT